MTLFTRTKDQSDVVRTVVECLTVRTATDTLTALTATEPEVVRTTPILLYAFTAPETIYVTP